MSLESEIVSLEVGKKADLVVFDFRRPHLCIRRSTQRARWYTRGRDAAWQ